MKSFAQTSCFLIWILQHSFIDPLLLNFNMTLMMFPTYKLYSLKILLSVVCYKEQMWEQPNGRDMYVPVWKWLGSYVCRALISSLGHNLANKLMCSLTGSSLKTMFRRFNGGEIIFLTLYRRYSWISYNIKLINWKVKYLVSITKINEHNFTKQDFKNKTRYEAK